MPFVSNTELRDVREVWREGVDTLPLANATLGSHQLNAFTQECAPGMGAPLHEHVVEEVLHVLSGEARITLGDETRDCRSGDVAIIPAGTPHGFVNTSVDQPLQMLAILASPIFEARYLPTPDAPADTPVRDVRRWQP